MTGRERRQRPILIAGCPRSGTTWVSQVLGRDDRVAVVFEPDNEWPNFFALKAKLPLGRFPALTSGDDAPREYEHLWRRSFDGYGKLRGLPRLTAWVDSGERTIKEHWEALCDHANPRVSRRLRFWCSWAAIPPVRRLPGDVVLVKSVYAPLALEWISARFDPRMLIVLRHPMNIIASWHGFTWGGCALESNPRVRERFGERWGLPELPAQTTSLQRVAWEVGLFTCALEEAAGRPESIVIRHDDLCLDPRGGFRLLAERLDLEWTTEAEEYLEERNRHGEGYVVARVAAEQPERWRTRLTSEEIEEAWDVLSRFQAPWVERVARDVTGFLSSSESRLPRPRSDITRGVSRG